jgi:hypothetical protein
VRRRCGNAGGPLEPGDLAVVEWFTAWLAWRKTYDEQGPEAAGPEPVKAGGEPLTTGEETTDA